MTAQAASPHIGVTVYLPSSPSVQVINGDTYNFGTVDLNSTSTFQLVINNSGNANLTIVGKPTITGPDAADFIVRKNPTTTIAAGANSSFVFNFTPTTLGTKNAVVTIVSDDPNDSPFIVTITGSVINKTVYVYEDAQDGKTSRWTYNGNGLPASITNVADDQAHGRAIRINVTDVETQNYILHNGDGVSSWLNQKAKVLKFDLKTSNEAYAYAMVQSNGKIYFLSYSFNNPQVGLVGDRYVYIRLDPALKDGNWHTITRDLEADLQSVLPGNTITVVAQFYVGSTDALVDNVLLTTIRPVDQHILGTIVDNNNQPMAGVVVTVSPSNAIAVTDNNGHYAFSAVTDGVYSVTPSNDTHTFAPLVTTVTVAGNSATADFVGTKNLFTMYEDAESGTTFKWKVNAPGSVNTIANVIDDQAHGNVIEITNADPYNYDYILSKKDGVSAWHNTSDTKLAFDIKTTNETYAYARVQTNLGQYYVLYSFNFPRTGLTDGSYISIHLDPTYKDGAWHTVMRDLQADVASVVPGATITSVENFIVGSTGVRVDNIQLSSQIATYSISGVVRDNSNQPLAGVRVFLNPGQSQVVTDQNGAYTFPSLTNGTYTISSGDQAYVFTPVSITVTIAGANGTANFIATANNEHVYEDGEDGSAARWGANPPGAVGVSATNVVDDQAHNRVIEIVTPDINNQDFYLRGERGDSYWRNTDAKTLAFDLKTTNETYTYVRVETAQKTYYLMYSFAYPTGLKFGSYVSINLVPGLKDGNWHTITRNLQNDLDSITGGTPITSVEQFYVGSTSARVDNVKMIK